MPKGADDKALKRKGRKSVMKLTEIVEGLQATEKLYLKDSYLKKASARVLRVVREKGRRYYLVTTPSIFHPLSGGQPSDRGWLTGDVTFEVKKVLESDGVIVLYGKLIEGELVEGMDVTQVLDWERRYYIMRLHTAGHVIDRAVSDILGRSVRTLGALHGPPRAYVEYGTSMSSSLLSEIERRANELLDSRHVLVLEVSREELPKRIYGAPNLGRLPELASYRIVEIEGVNAIPCSGTHVKNTSEIGRIEILGLEEIEGGVRLFYDVKQVMRA